MSRLRALRRVVCLGLIVTVFGTATARVLLAQPKDNLPLQFSPDQVDESVERALAFLASQQTDEGAWRTEAWGESTAITSLAIMSFLAAGYAPDDGPYGEQITRGIHWVVGQQQPNGMLIVRSQSHGPMYDHGICTLMLAEVSGMLDGPDELIVRRALEKATLLILESQAVRKQNRHEGGWRYQVDSRDSDLSVTGWQVMALRAAKDIGCDVPAEAIDFAIEYVKQCADANQKGFGYQPGNGATPTMTGTGITCLEVCGAHRTDEALAGANFLLTRPLREQTPYFYYGVYYTGVGMFKIGEEFAEATHQHLVSTLIPIQQADGGWNPVHGSERQAGRIYSTSMSVLALTVEYRYLPIYQR